MPAIASLEDLKAAQKEGLSFYAMRYALCALLYGSGPRPLGVLERSDLSIGVVLAGKICVEPHGQARCSILNACVGRHPGQELVALCCRGKL